MSITAGIPITTPGGGNASPRGYQPSTRGLPFLVGGLLVAGWLVYTNQQRMPWVATDYKSLQGNYMGHYHSGKGRRYISVYNHHRVYTIQIADKVYPRLPGAGGLIEVKYLDQNGIKQIVQESDVSVVNIPDVYNPGREDLSTNYGFVED